MKHKSKPEPDKQSEKSIDDALADSFPASDPPANSGITGVGDRKRSENKRPSNERGDEARPKGTPTSDWHATETAHAWEDDKLPDTPK